MRVWEYDCEICTYRSREFDEILDITGMRQEDLDAFVGCLVLDSHSTWSTADIVGVIDETCINDPNIALGLLWDILDGSWHWI